MMKIIISPAKKMNRKEDSLECSGLPCYLEKANYLMKYVRSLSYEQAKAVWNCNDKIAKLNYDRFLHMDLEHRLTPAIISYEGIQYQYMAPDVFDWSELQYVQEHLLILSGFYGVLRPLDGIVPYRLEMQAKVDFDFGGMRCKSLYDYWEDEICRKVTEADKLILNLASKEYSRAVEPYLGPDVRFVSCVFGCMEKDKKGNDKVKVKATEAKMARGEMVRHLAQRKIENLDEVKEFDRLGYRYEEELSDSSHLVFIK